MRTPLDLLSVGIFIPVTSDLSRRLPLVKIDHLELAAPFSEVSSSSEIC